MELQNEATAVGKRIEFLNVIDRGRPVCLARCAASGCMAKDVVKVLRALEPVTTYGIHPIVICSEFIAYALRS